MKKAVMFGGGNIGRGFIGALLSQSGYEVTFIDVAEPVVKALQEMGLSETIRGEKLTLEDFARLSDLLNE